MAREITSSWICSVPSKMSKIIPRCRITAGQRGQEWFSRVTVTQIDGSQSLPRVLPRPDYVRHLRPRDHAWGDTTRGGSYGK
jgi:hypothetical protein